jgi:hypothetical protein
MWDNDFSELPKSEVPKTFWDEILNLLLTPAFLVTLYNVTIMLLGIILISMFLRTHL